MVCGYEPMVVVGSVGRFSRFCCAVRRSAAMPRPDAPAARMASSLERISVLFSRGSVLREAAAALEVSISEAMASRPCASPFCQGHHFGDLLGAECQPATQCLIEVGLGRQ